MRRMPVPSPSTSRAGRSPSRAATFLVLALVATSVMAMPPAAAIDPLPADAPTAGQEITIDYPAEPEYLLVAGRDRWNVRNTPDGTLASGYGVPEDAVHDLYAKSGRYEPLASDPSGSILDISVRDAAPQVGLDHGWTFVRKDDGTAEVWGPADLGYPERYVIEPPTDQPDDEIVGGTVRSDNGEIPVSVVITVDGDVFEVVGDGAPTLLDYGLGGDRAVAAIARDHSTHVEPALDVATPANGYELTPGERGTEPSAPALIAFVLEGGYVAHGPLDETAFTDAWKTEVFLDRVTPADLANTPDAIVDVDFGCVEAAYSSVGNYSFDDEHEAPFNGSVSKELGCPQVTELGLDAGPERSVGRISVAVGVQRPSGETEVEVLTKSDYVQFERAALGAVHTQTFDDRIRETGCAFPAADTVGARSFDLRVVLGRTHLACIRPGDGAADETEIQTYLHPDLEFVFSGDTRQTLLAARSPVIVAHDFGLFTNPPTIQLRSGGVSNVTRRGAQTERVQRRTFDRQAQLSSGVDVSTPVTQTFTDLESLSIQIEFPCEQVVGRTLGLAPGARLSDCYSDLAVVEDTQLDAKSPKGIVSYAVAGYGQVADERRLFVGHQVDRDLFEEARDRSIERAGGDPEPPVGPGFASWVVEPVPHRASDLAALAAAPLTTDASLFDAYAPPQTGTAPPVLLTEIPRGVTTPLRIRIGTAPYRIEEKPAMPLAVLQAPPIVAGLGQQTDFTPEFAQTSSTGSESTVSKSTRVGTHASIEGTVTTGVGALGNHIRAGGGARGEYAFMNEVEEELTNAFELETSEGYGGAFDDHTVVTRSTQEYVWDATVIEDPAGFTTGQQFDYGVPAGEITQAVPLSTLEAESPGLYGDRGIFRPTIDAIIGGAQIGDPGSYRPGADSAQPQTILRANGGPCSGGYVDSDNRTPPDGRLAAIVSPDNPFYADDPKPPTGSDVVLSASHAVSAGNGLTESAAITLSSSTTESKLTSKSHDFAVTGIFKFEYENATGLSTGGELTIEAGVDSGFSTGAGVSDSLGEGSGLSTVMGNIPLSPADKPWVEAEQYTWRMYMCKAQLGPAGLGSEIWVQGYVVDDYSGSGGIEVLAPVEAQAPIASAVAYADPAAAPTGTVEHCASVGPRDNRFEWHQSAGTVDRYAIELTNVTGGGGEQRVIADLERPADFDPALSASWTAVHREPLGRVDCAGIGAGDFVDGDLYRWRAVVDGFTDNRETSDWEFFRPQVWPPSQTLSLRTPIVNPDDSVSLDIDDPVGVTSLRHDVTVFEIDPETGARTAAVATGTGLTGEYRTPTLAPGRYEAEVIGHNSHVLDGGARADTPPVTVQFQVEETLLSQFTYGGCSEDPCNTTDVIEFTDESLPANDVPVVAWRWYFGDGTTSTERNPTHRFSDLPEDGSGTYDVFLTIEDAAGKTASLREEIPLQSAAPEIDTDGLETEIGVDQELTMALSASDPDNEGRDPGALQVPTFEWDLDGDGVADVTQETFDSSVAHTFGAAGEHPVTVTVTDPFGRTDTHSFVVTVHAPPTADFTHTSCDVALAPDDPTCTPVGALVSFDPAPSSSTAGDLVAWEWDFGNGTTRTVTEPADQVVGVRYSESGTAAITLRVQDRFGQWSDALTRSIGIAPRPASGGGGGGGGVDEGGGTDEAPAEVVTVYAGTDRVGTAIAISESEFPDGSSSVVLADAGAYADALAGTPLAVAKGAPLLLTDTARVDTRVADEIVRLLDPGGTVYVLGGPAALSEDVEAEVVDLGFEVTRFAGATRYDTAVAIAEDGLGSPGTVLLTTGQGFADGLTAGTAAATVGGAVLLTDGDRLPAATAAYLDRHQVSTRYAVGGPAVAADPTATPIAGADRYATATALAEAFFDGPSFVGITSGLVFADALGGGVVAARHGGPLLLTDPDDLPVATAGYLADNATGITEVQLYGGPSAISQAVRDAVSSLLAVSRALALVGP